MRHRLPYSGIARHRRYYAKIRLPASCLAPSLVIACRPYSIAEGNAGSPELPLHTHVKRAKAYDPGEIPSPRPLGFQDAAFWPGKAIGFPIRLYFGAQHLQLLLSARLLLCLRLGGPVARPSPRLSTGGWLGLAGRDSLPLYVKATYARPHCLAQSCAVDDVSRPFKGRFCKR